MAEEQCTAIVAYEVEAADAERFLDSWKRANSVLEEQPGFIDTALHRATSANPDFRFVNVSRWESADAFRDATQHQTFKEASGRLEAFPLHASVYEIAQP